MSKQVVTKLVVNTRKRNKATTFSTNIDPSDFNICEYFFIQQFRHREYFIPTCSSSTSSFGF